MYPYYYQSGLHPVALGSFLDITILLLQWLCKVKDGREWAWNSWHAMGYWPPLQQKWPRQNWSPSQSWKFLISPAFEFFTSTPLSYRFLTTLWMEAKNMKMWIWYKILFNATSEKWKTQAKPKENKA